MTSRYEKWKTILKVVGVALVILGVLAGFVFNEVYGPVSGTFEVLREEDITPNTTFRVVSLHGRRFVVVNGVNKLAVCPW